MMFSIVVLQQKGEEDLRAGERPYIMGERIFILPGIRMFIRI
jgi:hypothetical protein